VPTIGINEPANNFETKEKTVKLRGSVADPTASVSAKLNGKDLGKLTVATDSGVFQKEIELVEGLNKIVVNALSVNGATSSATISGTLLKGINNLAMYLLLTVLALVAAFGVLISVKFMSKKLKKNLDGQTNKTEDSETKPSGNQDQPTETK
jgi:hypothetical protein